MSADPDQEYLTAQQVADLRGITLKTLREALSRGRAPEPDLIVRTHTYWLPETIERWNARKGKRGQVKIPRKHRVRGKQADKPPRVKTLYGEKVEAPPEVTIIRKPRAREIAQALREEGFYVTSDDVMALAAHDGDRLPHEREQLRQRVLAKVRGLQRRQRS